MTPPSDMPGFNPADSHPDQLLLALKERAKELNCLYEVDAALSRSQSPMDAVFQRIIDAIPPGWQYPEICGGRVMLDGFICIPPVHVETPWQLVADIRVFDERVGEIIVYYTEHRPDLDEGPFLKEERRLIDAIAERIGMWVMQTRLREEHDRYEKTVTELSGSERQPWRVLLEFLRRTDPNLMRRVTRKMINQLCWAGASEGALLLQASLESDHSEEEIDDTNGVGDGNRPLQKRVLIDVGDVTERTFRAAARHFSEHEIINHMQGWINEEKSTFLVKSLENPGSGVAEMADAIERFQSAGIEETSLSPAVQMSLKVALLRRFFVDSLDFINIAKQHVSVSDFYDLIKHLIYPSRSQGKLGGKGGGLFLASKILNRAVGEGRRAELLARLRIPRTWYVASDGMLEFIHYNDLDEVYNRKYMEIERVRQDYPHIVQVFKNSRFPPEVRKGLSAALDDLGDGPLIVRSSSLLEDRMGSAFSGKYKSLFLANQGPKSERLDALQDAIAEVYASVFGPDPIEYRAERGLIDFREEMGILIQQVVGQRVGPYFVPAFAGVAFSNNEFRWSPRIKREDGLARLVPGLGTRAVDRLSDDYPILISPGQPNLRANTTVDEIVRYAPTKIDVINLEQNWFETVDVVDLLRKYGDDFPMARRLISIVDGNRVRTPSALEPDWAKDDIVVTFQGLLEKEPTIETIRAMLEVLREHEGTPIDIEFACDGEHLYLVQCRSQSRSEEDAPAPIPRDLPREKIVFTANRFISNGRLPEISHIVYVDPNAYASLPDIQALRDVGRAVGELNLLLPKRQFILIGPGRWGSRGDIKLGVNVTYSDINNTAALLEVARKKGGYVPELSFGTHFFQDLVEAGIRYVPLYPDDPDIIFNELLLTRAPNILANLLPEYAHLADVVRVIDVRSATGGQILQILLNADLEEAVGLLTAPTGEAASVDGRFAIGGPAVEISAEDHWRWRLRMAEHLADTLDPQQFGVKALYVLGSTKNATAGPGSDIDLIIHDDGPGPLREQLQLWLDGWSRALAEVNYLRTGYRTDGLLDSHFVTDEDIKSQTSFAMKIGAVTDAARPLALRRPAVESGDEWRSAVMDSDSPSAPGASSSG